MSERSMLSAGGSGESPTLPMAVNPPVKEEVPCAELGLQFSIGIHFEQYLPQNFSTLRTAVPTFQLEVGNMPSTTTVDSIDARILDALNADPRATVIALADKTGLSRNTVQARLGKLDKRGVLNSFERRIGPGALGVPADRIQLHQRHALETNPNFIVAQRNARVHRLRGITDLLFHVVARAGRLYGHRRRRADHDLTGDAASLSGYRLTPLLKQLGD
ncbi:Lrp/AsnC family transcriptional regulator [Rhodococcus wratislaviensis]|uniref:Lrp/AsnC family transcriptional regulator n=1 Tax=Rhodococcus wratislaviensis TaxID=44752 RepID=UPI0036562997